MSAAWGDAVEWHVENAEQFWSELRDITRLPKRPTLDQLDNTIISYVKFCGRYHDDYLTTQQDVEHARSMVLESQLFRFHSTRMVDVLLRHAITDTSPESRLVVYSLLLVQGKQAPALFRNLPKWRGLLPQLMESLLVECEDNPRVPVHLTSKEEQVRLPATLLMYEVARVQKLDATDLALFSESFVNHLFTLIERTRLLDDESLNYALIRLIIALNEQFMVATLAPSVSHPPADAIAPASDKRVKPHKEHVEKHTSDGPTSTGQAKGANRVLAVLMRRLNESKTFGENMIFMLNRAENTPEDLCMQLLVLKILYLLFTTSDTKEYFYTNDLKVLVDVFIRELHDLPEESEALRHTYLRVLHPLLTNTQLRTLPYKRPELFHVLRAMIANPHEIRVITPTTKRLVERCLSAEWCAPFVCDKHTDDARATAVAGRCSYPSPSASIATPSAGGTSQPPKAGTLHTMRSLAGTLGVDAQAEADAVNPEDDAVSFSFNSTSPSRAMTRSLDSSAFLPSHQHSRQPHYPPSGPSTSLQAIQALSHLSIGTSPSAAGSSLSLNLVAAASTSPVSRISTAIPHSSSRRRAYSGDEAGMGSSGRGSPISDKLDSPVGGGRRTHGGEDTRHPLRANSLPDVAEGKVLRPLNSTENEQQQFQRERSVSPSPSSLSSSSFSSNASSSATAYHSHQHHAHSPAHHHVHHQHHHPTSTTTTRRKPPAPPVNRATKRTGYGAGGAGASAAGGAAGGGDGVVAAGTRTTWETFA